MKDITNTQFFQVETGPLLQAKDILEILYNDFNIITFCPVFVKFMHTIYFAFVLNLN